MIISVNTPLIEEMIGKPKIVKVFIKLEKIFDNYSYVASKIYSLKNLYCQRDSRLNLQLRIDKFTVKWKPSLSKITLFSLVRANAYENLIYHERTVIFSLQSDLIALIKMLHILTLSMHSPTRKYDDKKNNNNNLQSAERILFKFLLLLLLRK